MNSLQFIPQAEPFFFRGRDIGCLLLHGFTASPQEMLSLGQHLAAQEYTVYGPRLTHHGTMAEDMTRTHWHDWYFSALDGYHILRQQCAEVVVIGLSMGGSLALLLAVEQPVTALVVMAAPIHLTDWRMNYARTIARVYPFLPKQGFDPTQKLNARYAVQPVHAIAELRDMLAELRPRLSTITSPALIIHSLADEMIPLSNFDTIYREIGSSHKEKLILERSGHLVTEDVEQSQLFAQITEFVGRKTRPRSTLARWWHQLRPPQKRKK
ncbi:MAG: alpha/beta fold hydrolase [Chloroflexi bacterium]|nr:alpha/beta fold hydrolase [Chloroflexota bacterium]MBP8055849.1 alpha/beta fold hydrolase [Chloroflexota bacterium]